MVHWFLPQSVKAKFLIFFSSAPAQYSCLRLPAALQDNQVVPQLTHLAFTTGQPVLPGLYQLCRLLLGHLPQVACAFYLSGRC